MTDKTFVLGVGAPKSGTSWLYGYLDALTVSNMGPLKEYRIWDLHYTQTRITTRFNSRRLLKWRGGALIPQPSQYIRLRMALQEGYYERFFARFVDDGRWLTGDISRGYMTLTVDQLSAVANRLRGMGFRGKVRFLMSDQVERCWSRQSARRLP